MFSRRTGFAISLLFLASFAYSQEKVPNWPVAPFWSAPSIAKEEVELAPLAAEGVPTPPLPLTAIAPCRIADTRGNGFTGAYGAPSLTAGAPRNFALKGQCGIAESAEAVSLNITVTNTQGPGFILIYPQGGAQPTVSTLNYEANQTIANAAIVPLGAAGGVTVIAGVSGTDLIIDTNGYFWPQPVVNFVNGLTGSVGLLAGTNISITPAGNTLFVANTAPVAPAAWHLTGNAGTTAGTNFVGTTDNQPLEIKVNNQRILRLEPNATSPRVIGGHADNNALAGVLGATIGGGGAAGFGNAVTDYYGTVGGGRGNRAGNNAGTLFDSGNATVSGGLDNTAGGDRSTVGGGHSNTAGAQYSTVGGGFGNNASGGAATIPGGNQNRALGMGSFAAGTFAFADHDGTFVWGSNSAFAVSSSGANQFIVRAGGGIWLGTTGTPNLSSGFINTSTGAFLSAGGTWTNSSDVDRKENFEAADTQDVLARLAALPISTWTYKGEDCSVRHMGPTGQDFAAAFGLGSNEKSIATVDADGVALAAIQALYGEVQQLRKRVAELEAAKN